MAYRDLIKNEKYIKSCSLLPVCTRRLTASYGHLVPTGLNPKELITIPVILMDIQEQGERSTPYVVFPREKTMTQFLILKT